MHQQLHFSRCHDEARPVAQEGDTKRPFDSPPSNYKEQPERMLLFKSAVRHSGLSVLAQRALRSQAALMAVGDKEDIVGACGRF